MGPTTEHGLTVTFWPDDTIFETVEFDPEIIRARLREQAFLNAGVRLTLVVKAHILPTRPRRHALVAWRKKAYLSHAARAFIDSLVNYCRDKGDDI